METNEIKSFSKAIPLKQYFELDNIITKNLFQVGNIEYYKVSTKLQCQYKEDNTVALLLGQNANRSSLYLFEVGNGIVECEIDKIITFIECVLKKQIQHLKYVEQLNLFENGEENNG